MVEDWTDCPECDGAGSFRAGCTTFGPGCACGTEPRRPCGTCDTAGVVPVPVVYESGRKRTR